MNVIKIRLVLRNRPARGRHDEKGHGTGDHVFRIVAVAGVHREANVSGGINVTDARYFLLRWWRDAPRGLALAGTTSFSPGLPAPPPSFSLFLSSSLTILKFRPHPSLRKVAPIISIIKTRCTAAPCCLSPDVFPDAFKPTSAAGAFSDQLPSPSPVEATPVDNCHYYSPRSRIVTVETVKLLTQTLPAMCVAGTEDTTSLSTRVGVPDGGFVIVGNKSRRQRLPSKWYAKTVAAGFLSFDEKGRTDGRARAGLTKLGSEAEEGAFWLRASRLHRVALKRDARNIRRLRVNYAARRNYLPLSPLMKQFLTPT